MNKKRVIKNIKVLSNNISKYFQQKKLTEDDAYLYVLASNLDGLLKELDVVKAKLERFYD